MLILEIIVGITTGITVGIILYVGAIIFFGYMLPSLHQHIVRRRGRK